MTADPVSEAAIAGARAARGTVAEIAAEASYSRTTLDVYLNGRRPTSRAAALAIAGALEARAQRILEHAARIREAVRDPEDAQTDARRGHPRDR